VFGIDVRLDASTANQTYDTINAKLADESFRPRALFERFNIELLATTGVAARSAQSSQENSREWLEGQSRHRVPPDPVVDPEYEGFAERLAQFGAMTGEDTSTWNGYLNAHSPETRRFRQSGRHFNGPRSSKCGDLGSIRSRCGKVVRARCCAVACHRSTPRTFAR